MMRTKLLAIVGLTIIAAVIYGMSLNNPFIYDDDSQIVTNKAVHNFDVQAIFTGSTFESHGQDKPHGIYYKPFMSLTYAMLWKLSNGKPFVFHLFQLVISILNAFLIFWLVSYWVSVEISFFIALFFLVHPINTEVIVCIADMQDVLFFFWGMLTLILIQMKKTG